MLTLGQPFYSGYSVTIDVYSFREIREAVPDVLGFSPDRERILRFLGAGMRACYPGRPMLVDNPDVSDHNARTLAGSLDAAVRGAPGAGRRLRWVAWEETGLELDAGGGARAARDLRAAIDARSEVELVPVAQSPGGGGRLARGLLREAAWYPAGLPRRVRALRIDVCTARFRSRPLGTTRPRPWSRCTTRSWDHPEWLTPANGWHSRLVLARALKRADAIQVPSAHTRERLLARLSGLSDRRVHVVPLGIHPRFSPGPGPEAGPPYLLAVATLQPRKNPEGVLVAFARLRDLGTVNRLVVVGARGWRDEALIARLREEGGAELAGRIVDDELVSLYRSAACHVYPSSDEGFGFPRLEAMACGTPVVASRAGSLPAIVGDAAPLVDPERGRAGRRDRLRARRSGTLARAWQRPCGALQLGSLRAADGRALARRRRIAS